LKPARDVKNKAKKKKGYREPKAYRWVLVLATKGSRTSGDLGKGNEAARGPNKTRKKKTSQGRYQGKR